MTLKRKIGLEMLCGVLAVLVLAQAVQFVQTRRSNRRLAGAAVTLLEQRELQDVKNIHTALDVGLADCLARGNMDIFSELISLRKSIPGFEKFSLYDYKGKVAYSSDKTAIRKEMAPDLKSQLFTKPERMVRVSPDAIEIYKPEVATAKCLECHEDYKAGAVCGVSYFRFSNDAGARLSAEFGSINAGANRQWQAWTLGILVLGSAMAVGLTLAITRPILRTLTGIAKDLDVCGAEVNAAATEVEGASQTLAQQANEQAASLEQTSSALSHMASTTEKNAGHAVQASSLARQTRAAADEGVGDMRTMTTAMQELKTASDEIAKIIKTINGIAFQTNLLALNAAVEAARAGEAGMGFAVVADQVRTLAESCSQAARDTSDKIESTLVRASQGLKMSTKVGADLEAIAEKVHQVDGLIAEVAVASQEQSKGIEQLNGSLSEMGKVTRNNTDNAEKNAQAAESLNEHMHKLKASCGQLQKLVFGGGSEDLAPNQHLQEYPPHPTRDGSTILARSRSSLPPRDLVSSRH